MSNRTNYRRGEARRTETRRRYEHENPGSGNLRHVARARAGWIRIESRRARRLGRQRLALVGRRP